MQQSIVNFSEVRASTGFRMDAEYWHPLFIENSKLVSPNQRLKDVVEPNIANIKTAPIHRDFEYLEIANISSNLCQYETTNVQFGDEPERAHHILQKGDVAVSTVRPNRNAVALVEKDGIVGTSGLAVLRPNHIEPKYLFAFCKTNYFVNCLMRADKASMYPAVSNSDVLDTPVFVPTKSFQTTIVDTVRNSIACLAESKRIYAEVQTFLRSELGLADWQPKNQLTFVKNFSDTERANRFDADYFQPRYDDIVNAIKGYPGGWDTLGNLVTLEKCIEVGSRKYRETGIPFVRVSNLSPFEITQEKYISEELYAELKQHQPKQGEILLSKDATPGIAHHLREQPTKMIPAGGILRLKRKSELVRTAYLTLVLNSILGQEQVSRDVGGSVIPHWRPSQVAETLIPILPDEKQAEIERKVTESFNLRQQSKHLLECAKRAVDIAIEADEETALKWLETVSKSTNAAQAVPQFPQNAHPA